MRVTGEWAVGVGSVRVTLEGREITLTKTAPLQIPQHELVAVKHKKHATLLITLVLVAIAQGVYAEQAKKSPASPSTIYVSCDNALTDAAKINAAIAASPSGSEIVICGQALINRTIRLLGRRSYRGLSRTGTVLKQADGANLKALMASSTFVDNKTWTGLPISIRHLTLDGNKAKNPGGATTGIALRSWLSVIEDVVVRNMGGDGIRIFNFALRKNPMRGAASTYEYLALRTNYGTGVVSVTGNAIRGAGTKQEKALRYVAPPGKRLIVTSVGNVIEGIQNKRSSDGDVTISSGQ